jgi:hypothetical protein
MSSTWLKDPDDTLVYKFDWAPLANGTGDSNWLDQTSSPVETIVSQIITVDSPGPTVVASEITDNLTSVSVKLSGGVAGQAYDITNQITTSTPQIKTRTARLIVGQT